MLDKQLARLTDVLRLHRIWAINVGENFEVTQNAWQAFARALPDTAVAHLYVEENNLVGTDLKKQVRANSQSKHALSLRLHAVASLVPNTECRISECAGKAHSLLVCCLQTNLACAVFVVSMRFLHLQSASVLQMKDAIRVNRKCASARDPEVCAAVTNMWFNPIIPAEDFSPGAAVYESAHESDSGAPTLAQVVRLRQIEIDELRFRRAVAWAQDTTGALPRPAGGDAAHGVASDAAQRDSSAAVASSAASTSATVVLAARMAAAARTAPPPEGGAPVAACVATRSGAQRRQQPTGTMPFSQLHLSPLHPSHAPPKLLSPEAARRSASRSGEAGPTGNVNAGSAATYLLLSSKPPPAAAAGSSASDHFTLALPPLAPAQAMRMRTAHEAASAADDDMPPRFRHTRYCAGGHQQAQDPLERARQMAATRPPTLACADAPQKSCAKDITRQADGNASMFSIAPLLRCSQHLNASERSKGVRSPVQKQVTFTDALPAQLQAKQQECAVCSMTSSDSSSMCVPVVAEATVRLRDIATTSDHKAWIDQPAGSGAVTTNSSGGQHTSSASEGTTAAFGSSGQVMTQTLPAVVTAASTKALHPGSSPLAHSRSAVSHHHCSTHAAAASAHSPTSQTALSMLPAALGRSEGSSSAAVPLWTQGHSYLFHSPALTPAMLPKGLRHPLMSDKQKNAEQGKGGAAADQVCY